MSYAKINKEKVIATCEAYIVSTAEYIERAREKMIQKAMKPRRLLGTRTREEAIKYLEQDIWSEYNLISVSCAGRNVEAKKLLKLAKASDGDVYVKVDMAWLFK
jgi:hypothetical protein